MRSIAVMSLDRKHLRKVSSGEKSRRIPDSFPRCWYRIIIPQLSAGNCSMRFRRKQSAGLRQRALPRSPQQAGPAMQANMPCQNGLYAESAVPYTEGVLGTEKSKNGSSGDALADWTMGKNTVITPPRWMRSLFKKQSWRH